MSRIEEMIYENRLKMRRLLFNHMNYVQRVAKNYDCFESAATILRGNTENDMENLENASHSSSSSSSSTSCVGTMFPLFLDDKKTAMLHRMSATIKKVDKTLDKQLKNTKNKTSLLFKSLLLCQKIFNKIKKPMYSILGIVGIYTSITHLLILPDNLRQLIAATSAVLSNHKLYN